MNDAIKLQKLNVHCANLANIRMNIVCLEAYCTIRGWDIDLLIEWRGYNDALIKLGMQTKNLLPF